MIGFLMQDVHVNKMVKTENRYIPLNVGQVGHFQTPNIHGNLSDHGGTHDGSQHFMHIFKLVDNVGYRGVLILFTIANRHLSSGVVTEHIIPPWERA
jgi:hypothetical protein